MFTVREIAAEMKALSDGMDPFETILIIYGDRYLKEKKRKNDIYSLITRKFFQVTLSSTTNKKNFPKCYPSQSLCNTISSILFSFKDGRHVIISVCQIAEKRRLLDILPNIMRKVIQL